MDLEAQLHEEMIAINRRVGREIGYWASRYLQKIYRVGGLKTAKDSLKPKSSPTSGLQRLAEKGRLDLSVEALVLREPWSALFTHEELQVARQRINLVSSYQLAEEVVDEPHLLEGATYQVTINSYERNPEARRRCIEHHGQSCCICNFNFGKRYGEIAEGYIHVHHLKALSDIQQKYEVDPISDLRPVCANCHAVIHMGGRTRSIEEVKAMLLEKPKLLKLLTAR